MTLLKNTVPKLTPEQAEKEINEWLDNKKINAKKRIEKKENIDTLIGAMEEGSISIESDGTITQKLKIGTTGEDGQPGVTELKFKPRLKVSTVQVCLKGAALGDGYGVIIALAAALTGEPKNVIKDLDTEDFSVGSAIASFFL